MDKDSKKKSENSYDHKKIEKKWQTRWEKEGVNRPNKMKDAKDPFYNLWMFPYPSADGLHAGHAFSSTGSDVIGRFHRMNGMKVFQPIGYDSFGIHGENYAIRKGKHPMELIKKTTKTYERQLKSLGHGYDWTRTVTTSDTDYYRWTQWLFIKLFKAGLAYRKEAEVNWCPSCKTVLADEQVMSPAQAEKEPKNAKGEKVKDTGDLSVCERCGTVVERKKLAQWFFRITDYADKLLEGLVKIDWPEKIKLAQKNWIGRSEGVSIKFEILNPKLETTNKSQITNHKFIEVFTTRPDTLYGATFFVLSPEHPVVEKILSSEFKVEKQNITELSKYIKRVKSKTINDRVANKDKSGIFTGLYVINPANNKKIPIFVADYVLMDYGTGAIMGVPAHDQRDLEFARKNDIDVVNVLEPITGEERDDEEFRRSIVALVGNPKNGKFLSINWGEKLGGNLFVGGGRNEGEDPVKCAKREIREETGYVNVKLTNKSEKIHHHYHAISKGGYRNIEAIGLYFELVNQQKDNQNLQKDEEGKFKVEWISEDEVAVKINDSLHRYVYEKFVEKIAYDGPGILVNSREWDGLKVPKEISKTVSHVEKEGWGKKAKTYHLRDWLISRQRYWGPPIPMIYCQKCAKGGRGWFQPSHSGAKRSEAMESYKRDPISRSSSVQDDDIINTKQSDWESAGWYPVPEKDLPVELPYLKNFKPKGGGRGPLADSKKFLAVKCPECGSEAEREPDVSDTFLDSSWYFLAYPVQGTELWKRDPSVSSRCRQGHGGQAGQDAFDKNIMESWLPVDLYFGGAEHAVLHLMYSRFITKVLEDLKFIDFDEPFPKFFAHGLMIKDGAKMSKSRGNVVNPDEYIERFGADTLRLYLMFMGPMDGYPDFRDTGIEGMYRFISRIWELFQTDPTSLKLRRGDLKHIQVKLHQTIKKCTEDIQEYKYNTAIAAIMELVNVMKDIAQNNTELHAEKHGKNIQPAGSKNAWLKAVEALCLLLAPFAPHFTEEVWCEILGKDFTVHRSKWPEYDSRLTKEEKVTIAVQVNGKLRSTLEVDRSIAKEKGKVILLAKADSSISKWIKGKTLQREIFVPGRLVNFVEEQ